MQLNITSEQEKKRVGGYLYKNCHKFPTLYVNSENAETYLNHLEAVSNIFNMSGPYLMLLFAEICNVNGLSEPEEIDSLNKGANNFFLEGITKVSLANTQCNELANKIKESESLEINGKDYCFIVISLTELLHIYCYFIISLRNSKYCDKGMFVKSKEHSISTDALQQMLALLVSEEFEELRRFFHVVECLQSLFDSPTLH